MLRLKRRGLETELRTTLCGHKGGNPGYSQGQSYGPPRQSSTLPGTLLQTVEFHTSCSQPLFVEDQFGSVKVVSFVQE